MRIGKRIRTAVLFPAIFLIAIHAMAQRGGRGNAPASPAAPTSGYPQKPPADPAVVERGRMIYSTACAFCHGTDARGGEGGPNLLRSEIVLNDNKGELIAGPVKNGVSEMPKMDLTDQQISDVTAFIHSFRVGGYDVSRQRPATIVVGDAKAGEAYFQSKCASCHEINGDLKGFSSKYADARARQQAWLNPGAGRGAAASVSPATVTVTLQSGEKVSGRLVRIDDFIVTLLNVDATQRTFRRDGDVPKVEVRDPLQTHREFLRVYTDKDIHNVTAYLESLK